MSDSFTEVSSQGWLSRLGKSIVGILVGIVMFLVSFPVLFINEGRAVQTARSLEEGQAAVVSVPSDKIEAANDGKLIHVSGEATTKETLTDEQFGVAAPAIALFRGVEMYQWKETERKETRKRLGGGTETVTHYDYAKDWSDKFHDSKSFHKPDGHVNPPKMPYPAKSWYAKDVKVGVFELPADLIRRIGGKAPFPVTADTLPSDLRSKFKVEQGVYYQGRNPASPEVGDVRIAFEVVKPTTVSIVAQQTRNTFQPFQTKAGDAVQMLEMGNHSADQMFKTALEHNTTLTWVLRFVGFVIMAVGLMLVFNPIVVMADVLPFLGNMVGFVVSALAASFAAGLSLITISIAWLFYRPLLGVALLAAGVAAVVGVVYFVKKGRAAKTTT